MVSQRTITYIIDLSHVFAEYTLLLLALLPKVHFLKIYFYEAQLSLVLLPQSAFYCLGKALFADMVYFIKHFRIHPQQNFKIKSLSQKQEETWRIMASWLASMACLARNTVCQPLSINHYQLNAPHTWAQANLINTLNYCPAIPPPQVNIVCVKLTKTNKRSCVISKLCFLYQNHFS